MKYYYVIFGYKRDYFSVMFNEAIRNCDAEYIPDPIENSNCNKVLKLIYNIHHNQYLNWRWNFPFRHLWFPLYYNRRVDKPICFVFLMDWFNPKYIALYQLLKQKYPNCKFVVYFEDLISSRPQMDMNLLNIFDYGISYDKVDCMKYGLLQYPTFLSKIDIQPQLDKSTDACFIGLAKDRTVIINRVFQKLLDNGIKCNFVVSGKSSKSDKVNGICYINKDMPYRDYLQHVVNSKCIVEIIHHNAVGYTLRTWEALLYGKILLTNNPEILNASFYNSKQFVYFNNPEDIDTCALLEKIDFPAFEKQSVSPVLFLKFIDKLLSR